MSGASLVSWVILAIALFELFGFLLLDDLVFLEHFEGFGQRLGNVVPYNVWPDRLGPRFA